MAHITDNLILQQVDAAVGASANIPLPSIALDGYRPFSAVCAIGDTVHYVFREVDVVARPTGPTEVGRGTVMDAGGGALSIRRDSIYYSTNANSAVAFAAGSKHVALAAIAPSNRQAREDLQAALGLDFVGMVGLFPINTLRPGWIKANGAAISRTVYSRLFAYYGTTYGVGDGTTTFNVPDLRGEFPRFFDDGRGLDSGRVITVVQTGGVLSHTHSLSDAGHAHGVYDAGHAHGAYTDAQGYHDHANGLTSSDGGTMPSGRWDNNIPQWGLDGGRRTDAQGVHAHNVGVYAAGTGISIYGAGTGISVVAAGIAENRPRNIALAPFIFY